MAKRSSSRSSSRSSRSASKGASKVKTATTAKAIFNSFVIGVITGVVCCLTGLHLLEKKSQNADIEPAISFEPANTAAPVADQKPEITFYTLLEEAEVLVTVPAPEKPRKDVLYFLQAASFRDIDDANAARAELILLNLQVEISQSTLNGETWNRIIVGPFEGRSKLSKAQTTLLENGYGGMVLQRDK